MDEEERPRKLAKLEHDDQAINDKLGPAMTGAVAAADEPSQTVAPTNDNVPSEKAELPKSDNSIPTSDSALPEGVATQNAPPPLSKNQLRKLRKREQWEAGREQRKEKRREQMAKKKERRQLMVDQARETGGEEAVKALRKQWETTRSKSRRSTLLPVSIVIDCGYDELMNPHERISLAGQLTRSYSENTRAIWRSNLMFSSFDKQLKERFDKVLAPYRNWKGIRIIQEDFVHASEILKEQMASPKGGKLVGPFAEKTDAKPEDGEVIYLSSDSDNILTELKPYCTYIIGGLVDKNRYKAVCYKSAVAKGIKTAKLPIGDYIQMSSRQVLTTNHVVDIMLKWLELGDWGEAFMKVLPPRKGGKLREQQGDEAAEEVSDDEPEPTLEEIANEMEAEQEDDHDDEGDA
ncbi:tRNA (guanine(9)-N1)-methyltransferase [Penicillium cataractarum]|uniref:tRNA (guanine(9)-N1)-methyltransferase n=1 Tax=Penicillium cataractarum TaxID=2100454 RepID=A0A9W9SJD7_9EURO|nr:tRNA (guanine(9)-N1)-methyltransferase [Penicillium cataractarum]KAJ5377398.1 tRNA (guanine(9)-N1)-methyltransferase [Penicillium cataractarum]